MTQESRHKTPSDEQVLLYRRDQGIVTLQFNRPQVLNALNEDLSLALLEKIQEVEFDSSVRCLILTGSGSGFMSGGDIQFFQETLTLSPEKRRARFHTLIQHVHPVILSLKRMPKPVLASVNGVAAGYGLSLMMACDLVVASTKSSFTLSYSQMGLSPDGGATYSLPRVVGRQKAMAMALLGDSLTAEQALEWGLISRLTDPEKLETTTHKLATFLAAGPTKAFAKTKALLNGSFEKGLPQQLYEEENAFADCTASKDFEEAASAFLEKRPPVFQGA